MIERWEDFPLARDRIAAQLALRDEGAGLLAIRAAEPFYSRLESEGFRLTVEHRQPTFLVPRAAVFLALRHLPSRCDRWVRKQRPAWWGWYEREKRLHAERAQWESALASLSGAGVLPMDLEVRGRVTPYLPTAPDLYQYQRLGVAWLGLASGRAILGDDMGLGKTAQALVYCEGSSAHRILVVAPASVTLNWAREARRWAPSIAFRAPRDGRALRAGLEGGSPSGREAWVISWGLLARWMGLLMGAAFDTLIADEAHNAKEPAAKRTVALAALAHDAERRLLLTGTEVRSRPRELWSLLHLVDPVAYPLFKPFGERYCGARWQVNREGRRLRTYRGASRLRELNVKLRPLVQKRLKTEVIPQLPEKRRQTIPVRPLRGSARKRYREVVAMVHALAREGERDRALGKLVALRREVGLAKVHAALDWLRQPLDAGEQVVVFLEHKAVRESLEEGLRKIGVPYGVIVGDTPRAKRQGVVDAFQAGRLRVLVGSQACKEGVTLTAATFALQLEYWWVPGDLAQAEDRIWRLGQTREVLCVRLHLEDSIDDFVAASLANKRRVLGALSDRTPLHADVLARLLEEG